MRILVLGAGGLLGSAFVEHFRHHDVVMAGRDRLSGAVPDGVSALVETSAPDVVVNCAADTDVEGAEHDPAASEMANKRLPGLLAAACKRAGVVLVHLSSTGCYGTAKNEPYVETDEAQPTTTHHRHKLGGEQQLLASGCEVLILRTGWLFGGKPAQPKNFVWNRLVEARTKMRMASDPFQRGNPTYVGDVARQCASLLERKVRGTFNCVSGPAATRLDYVRAIVRISGLPCEVVASETPFKRLAQVSPNEAAENRGLRDLGLDLMPPWPQALPAYISTLMASDLWQRETAEASSRAS